MTKLRLLRIEPLTAGLTSGLLAVVIATLSFSLVGVEQYLLGQGLDLLLNMPLKVAYYGLVVSLSVFATTLAFNIAVRYTGGIVLTFRDDRLAKADDGPVVIGPPRELP